MGHTFNEKYAEQKELIRNLQVNRRVSLTADEIAEALVCKGLPMQPVEDAVSVKTTSNGDCLYNAVSLALNGTESYTDLLRLLTTLELLLIADYYIRYPKLT